jgi:predicted TIM-barrel fold metal-dependent hydrolase
MSTQPARGWDCHAHLFGPYERYPLATERSYTPPEATAEDYEALLARLNLSQGVLVHPSAYGDDLQLLLDALERYPRWRGVVVIGPSSAWPLAQLRARGVRGARFSHRSGAGVNFAGSASIEDLRALAPRLADAGLHAELWTDCQALPGIANFLRRLPVPVVIDHMGGFDARAGVDEPGFRQLLSLVEQGHVHVKLCAYRNLLATRDADDGCMFHRALLAANPEALVWGSDWPHLRVQPVPDAAQWLQRMRGWTADPALEERILMLNPARLYG